MSQAEPAERMGVDRAYISGLEGGARNPTIFTLWHTAVALDIDVSCLLVNEARRIAGKGLGLNWKQDGGFVLFPCFLVPELNPDGL